MKLPAMGLCLQQQPDWKTDWSSRGTDVVVGSKVEPPNGSAGESIPRRIALTRPNKRKDCLGVKRTRRGCVYQESHYISLTYPLARASSSC